MKNIVLLTAAGIGSRTHQDIPKQFICVDNIPIIVYTMLAFQEHPNIDEICVSILKGWEEILWAYARQFNITKLKYVVTGGESGQESIFNGLHKIMEEASPDDTIMVHDGNRPLVSQDIITDSLVKYAQHGSAVAVIPCTEVIFQLDKDHNSSDMLLERELIVRTQTPHTYRLGDLYSMHIKAQEAGITNTAASCALAQALGYKSFFSKGSEMNLKITTVEDIEIFTALLKSQKMKWIK